MGAGQGLETRYVCPQMPCSKASTPINSRNPPSASSPGAPQSVLHQGHRSPPSALPHPPDEKMSPLHLWTLNIRSAQSGACSTKRLGEPRNRRFFSNQVSLVCAPLLQHLWTICLHSVWDDPSSQPLCSLSNTLLLFTVSLTDLKIYIYYGVLCACVCANAHTHGNAQKTSGRIHSKQSPGTLPSAGATVLSKAAPPLYKSAE